MLLNSKCQFCYIFIYKIYLMENHEEMQQYKDSTDFDTGASKLRDKEVKTTSDFSDSCNLENKDMDDDPKKKSWYYSSTAVTSSNYLSLFVLGISTWVLLWCAWGDGWRWDGDWFRLAAVTAVAWASGQLLQSLTTLPPLLAALLTGIFARNLNILNMRHFTQTDEFLRKIYPVIILGKASLGWDLKYIWYNWRQVTALGVLPWCAEVMTLAACTNLLLGFPWIWGFLLGSIYASVSCAIVMPSVLRIGADAGPRNWGQLVCTAGGTDTALSVGVYGLIYSYMFFETDDIYRYVKAGLTLLVGVALGVIWGSLAGLVPHSLDYYVKEIRILFVLVGGLLGNFFTMQVGWGGTGGVAVLACNATAAAHWARDGDDWKLNKNAAATAYRVIWAACEPMLFAYTGTFFVINTATLNTLSVGVAILTICLGVRLAVTALVCWDMTHKEKIFICCTWIPKSIVEAVLCPAAINTLLTSPSHDKQEMEYAEDLVRLIVQAIIITTPIGFLLTNNLGPYLLKKTQKDGDSGFEPQSRKSFSESQNEDAKSTATA